VAGGSPAANNGGMSVPATESTPKRFLAQRERQPEWMDEPDIDPVLHRQALAGLARLNACGRSSGMLFGALRRFKQQPLRILDVACGGGDVTLKLARRAAREGSHWEFSGVDKSATALDVAAKRAAAAGVKVKFQPLDVLADDVPGGFDVIICSLFLHHLSDEEALCLLRRMAVAARSLVVISDLHRSRLNYAMTLAACQLATRSPVVHKDGPLSIRAAFSLSEARALAESAGLTGARVRPQFPVRWLLEWNKP
jgi:2-polyprenyl-3-methyl-5-hydroxy-6-metoxy-1,4-benzoquinol methylase